MAWFSSAHSRKMAEKQGRGQVNTPNIFCLFWIWSPVSFFLVGIPYVYASILFFCITVHLVFVYSNHSALAFSSGLDFGMPPLSFSLNRDVLGSNLSSGLLWTHGNIIISRTPSIAWSILWLLIIVLFLQLHFTWKGPYLCHPFLSCSENWEVEIAIPKEWRFRLWYKQLLYSQVLSTLRCS